MSLFVPSSSRSRSISVLVVILLLLMSTLLIASAGAQNAGPIPSSPAAANVLALASRNSAGTAPANDESRKNVISADGRFVVFTSLATDLVGGGLVDNNGASDVFLYDRLNNVTRLVSHKGSSNSTANGASGLIGTSTSIGISADARFVTFASQASDVVPLDTNGTTDVFIWRQSNGSVQLVSSKQGDLTNGGNGPSASPVMSANGNFIAFTSNATDLTTTPDTNGKPDLYVRNLNTLVTTLVSVNSAGNNSGNDQSPVSTSISDDGRFVAFESLAGDLVSNDTNGSGPFGADVFVRDVQSQFTTLVSVNTAGTGSGNLSSSGSGVKISGNGQFVVFTSNATNLVSGITDGGNDGDVFVRNLVSGTTAIVTADSTNTAVGGANPAVSSDGRFVAFTTTASLAPEDTNAFDDLYVRDMLTGTFELVSINAAGTSAGSTSTLNSPKISPDGRFVLFSSAASNLANISDTNSTNDLFLRDLVTNTTTLITVNILGQPAGMSPFDEYSLSADARVAAFETTEPYLLQVDENSLSDIFTYGPPPPGLSINDVSVIEGDSGTKDAVFTVTLADGPTSGNVTATALALGVTAFPPHDFQTVSQPLTFAPGETSKTVAVPIIGDTLFEGDETFTLELRDVSGAAVADGVGLGTIIENESRPTLFVNDMSITEGDSGTKQANIVVSLTGPMTAQAGFSFSLANGSALAREDYSEIGGGSLVAPGLTSTTIQVPIIGDTITEGNETFFFNISNPTNVTISDNQGVATIIDDEDSTEPPTVQLTALRPTVSEGAGSVLIEVTRSGNLSGAASVEYTTTSLSASERSDFSTAIGKLNFGPGESSTSFRLFITDDAFPEGFEVLGINLANPIGVSLGEPVSGTMQILDNDVSGQPNPIDNASFFVRQHYVDFFNREPDAAGLAFWTNQITECQQPGATCDPEVRRINVSAAFFLSIEFQETGYFVYRMYKAAYANVPGTPVPLRLNEFLPDTQQIGKDVIVGQTGWEQKLAQNKIAFVLDFVTRPRFTSAYPTSISPTQFVNTLYANAGVIPTDAERTMVINGFGGAPNTADVNARVRALALVAENSILIEQEKNRAFVLAQYFGYLRRNPNDAPEPGLNFDGYNFWLGKLNQFNGNFVNAEMVKAFITSGEYRQRFGQ